jgi:uncharacterized protein YcbX
MTVVLGSVAGLRRYPVKSMLGEQLTEAEVTERGLAGDRAYALVNHSDGKVATAKNPRKWPHLFDCHAAFESTPKSGAAIPPVRITLPDGRSVTSEAPDRDEILSHAMNRSVTLEAAAGRLEAGASSKSEAYWPDMEGLTHRNIVTEFELPEGTFFDGGLIHLLATATLARLGQLYPDGRFEAPRFRPNVVVETSAGSIGFIENDWIDKTLVIGDEVRLRVTRPCSRCVMTTLPQVDLPGDLEVLRTVAKHNQAHAGVYVSVEQGGTVRIGDPVLFE